VEVRPRFEANAMSSCRRAGWSLKLIKKSAQVGDSFWPPAGVKSTDARWPRGNAQET
jgi:hypothetical protein